MKTYRNIKKELFLEFQEKHNAIMQIAKSQERLALTGYYNSNKFDKLRPISLSNFPYGYCMNSQINLTNVSIVKGTAENTFSASVVGDVKIYHNKRTNSGRLVTDNSWHTKGYEIHIEQTFPLNENFYIICKDKTQISQEKWEERNRNIGPISKEDCDKITKYVNNLLNERANKKEIKKMLNENARWHFINNLQKEVGLNLGEGFVSQLSLKRNVLELSNIYKGGYIPKGGIFEISEGVSAQIEKVVIDRPLGGKLSYVFGRNCLIDVFGVKTEEYTNLLISEWCAAF